MVATVAVVYLDDLVDELISDDVSAVLSFPGGVLFDDFLDVSEHSLVSDDLPCAIDPQKESVLQDAEVCLIPRVHVQIINLSFVLDVEILSAPADLRVSSV